MSTPTPVDSIPVLLPDGSLPEEARTDVLQIVNEAGRVHTGLVWSGTVDLASLAGEPVVLHATLTGDVTLNLPPMPGQRSYVVSCRLAQDGTGNRQVTVPGAAMAWATSYVHTGTPNSVDWVHLMWSGTEWLCLPAAQNVGTPTEWIV